MQSHIVCHRCRTTHLVPKEHIQGKKTSFCCTKCGNNVFLAKTQKNFSRYQLITQLATGGMAEIFLASNHSLAGFRKIVVIKKLLPHLARKKRFVKMFLDEARIAARLNHTNVVQIIDVDSFDGQYFIAMKYLPGASLYEVMKACRLHGKRIPFELVAGIIMQAAEGLHYAHSISDDDGNPLNIVHRNISPQNIFVLYGGGVTVLDFGIAKAAHRRCKTRTGTIKGKFSYMSPEQIKAQDLDARSDLFSLGVVMWECLVGRRLFRTKSNLRIMQTIVQKDIPSPRKVEPQIPKQFDRILSKLLSRNREQLYRNASYLRNDLSTFLRGSRVVADTMAIGRFMQEIIFKQIQKERNLFQIATAVEQDSTGSFTDHVCQHKQDNDSLISNKNYKTSQSSKTGILTVSCTQLSHFFKNAPAFSFYAVLFIILLSLTTSFVYLLLDMIDRDKKPTSQVERNPRFSKAQTKLGFQTANPLAGAPIPAHIVIFVPAQPLSKEGPVAPKPTSTSEEKKSRPENKKLMLDYIRKKLASHRARFQQCANEFLARAESELITNVVLDITIKSNGRVGRALWIPKELQASQFGQCLLGRVRRVTFAARKEKSVAFSFPLKFKAMIH